MPAKHLASRHWSTTLLNLKSDGSGLNRYGVRDESKHSHT